jgi:hypothetical protein
MPAVLTERVWLTGTQVSKAVLFHLVDEGWFKEVPWGVKKWLTDHLTESRKLDFAAEQWRSSQTGTKRMLWMLTSAGLDPFMLCKFADAKTTKMMHNRFTDIIDTWGAEQTAS